jgi:hypothetical protein
VTHNSQRIARIEQSRQPSQTDPRGRIDPSRLHAALDVERKLSTQEQTLSPCALNLLGDFLKISVILWRYRSLRQNATSSLRARRTCGKGFQTCDRGSGSGAGRWPAARGANRRVSAEHKASVIGRHRGPAAGREASQRMARRGRSIQSTAAFYFIALGARL